MAELKSAALLSQEGYLTNVKYMEISNMDTSNITSDQMGLLSSIVTDQVTISNMSPLSQLGSILDSVKCQWLQLGNMALSEEDTQALVTTMGARVQTVLLERGITLYQETLAAYDGQGHCTKIYVEGDTRDGYGDRLRSWAADRGWTVTENSWCLGIERN